MLAESRRSCDAIGNRPLPAIPAGRTQRVRPDNQVVSRRSDGAHGVLERPDRGDAPAVGDHTARSAPIRLRTASGRLCQEFGGAASGDLAELLSVRAAGGSERSEPGQAAAKSPAGSQAPALPHDRRDLAVTARTTGRRTDGTAGPCDSRDNLLGGTASERISGDQRRRLGSRRRPGARAGQGAPRAVGAIGPFCHLGHLALDGCPHTPPDIADGAAPVPQQVRASLDHPQRGADVGEVPETDRLGSPHIAAHVAAQLRHTPARSGSRHSQRAGIARAQESGDDADLHAHQHGRTARGV